MPRELLIEKIEKETENLSLDIRIESRGRLNWPPKISRF